MHIGGRGAPTGDTLPTAVRCAVQEEEKNKIQNDLRILTERLSRINESLARKVRPRAHVPERYRAAECARFARVSAGEMEHG